MDVEKCAWCGKEPREQVFGGGTIYYCSSGECIGSDVMLRCDLWTAHMEQVRARLREAFEAGRAIYSADEGTSSYQYEDFDDWQNPR